MAPVKLSFGSLPNILCRRFKPLAWGARGTDNMALFFALRQSHKILGPDTHLQPTRKSWQPAWTWMVVEALRMISIMHCRYTYIECIVDRAYNEARES
jgi:hypothetical protein